MSITISNLIKLTLCFSIIFHSTAYSRTKNNAARHCQKMNPDGPYRSQLLFFDYLRRGQWALYLVKQGDYFTFKSCEHPRRRADIREPFVPYPEEACDILSPIMIHKSQIHTFHQFLNQALEAKTVLEQKRLRNDKYFEYMESFFNFLNGKIQIVVAAGLGAGFGLFAWRVSKYQKKIRKWLKPKKLPKDLKKAPRMGGGWQIVAVQAIIMFVLYVLSETVFAEDDTPKEKKKKTSFANRSFKEIRRMLNHLESHQLPVSEDFRPVLIQLIKYHLIDSIKTASEKQVETLHCKPL